MKKAGLRFLVMVLIAVNLYTYISGQGKVAITIDGQVYLVPAVSFFFIFVLLGYIFSLIDNTIFGTKDNYKD